MSDIRMTRVDDQDLDDTLTDNTSYAPNATGSRYNTTGTGYNMVSATFDNRADAESAVNWLRQNGVADNAISIVARHGDDYTATGAVADAADDAGDAAKGAGKGALAGAGVGALFGLAAAAIPGVGPFITAGWLTGILGATGGAAVAGAVVGGTSGALAGAFSQAGLNDDEAHHYAGEVERGSTYVAVDLSQSAGVSRDTILDGFRRFHGRSYA